MSTFFIIEVYQNALRKFGLAKATVCAIITAMGYVEGDWEDSEPGDAVYNLSAFADFLDVPDNAAKAPLDLFDMPNRIYVRAHDPEIRVDAVLHRYDVFSDNKAPILVFAMDNENVKLQWDANTEELTFEDLYHAFYDQLLLAMYPDANPLTSDDEPLLLLKPQRSTRTSLSIDVDSNTNFSMETDNLAQLSLDVGDYSKLIDLESIKSACFTLSLSSGSQVVLKYCRGKNMPYLILQMSNSEVSRISSEVVEMIFETHASASIDHDEYAPKTAKALKRILEYEVDY